MAEEIGFENGRNSNFQGLVTVTLTLDPAIRHTVVHHSSTSTYIPNFIEIGWNFFRKSPLRFCPSSKSRDTKTRKNIKNPARWNLDIVLYGSLRISGHLPAPIVNGGVDRFWKWKEFKLSRARDRDLDLGSGHTAYFYGMLRHAFGSRPNNYTLSHCDLHLWLMYARVRKSLALKILVSAAD